MTAVSKVWSPVNQAWLVLWHDQVLRVLTSEPEADHYIAEITGRTSGIRGEYHGGVEVGRVVPKDRQGQKPGPESL